MRDEGWRNSISRKTDLILPETTGRLQLVAMNRNERAEFVAQRLAELYPHPAIPLVHKDPFTLLVAVVLSAQCTDVRVNQVTPKLFALADAPQKMAALTVAQID